MACRTPRPKRELVRLVRTPEGTIILDPSGRAAGRGAYLCRDADCWSAAGKRHAIEHALRGPLPDDLAAQLAAGPDALGVPTIDNRSTGAASSQDDSAPTPLTDTVEGGTHGQE